MAGSRQFDVPAQRYSDSVFRPDDRLFESEQPELEATVKLPMKKTKLKPNQAAAQSSQRELRYSNRPLCS